MSSLTTAQSRRIATLAGHFRGAEAGDVALVQAFPTMAMASSVFEHVQQAPEDPILGVIRFDPLTSLVFCLPMNHRSLNMDPIKLQQFLVLGLIRSLRTSQRGGSGFCIWNCF